MNEQLALDSPQEKTQVEGPVDSLGMSFENDEKRRDHFLEKLRGKLKDPEFRHTEGFPIGLDEDILALSDPPFYTACPNPFLEDFIEGFRINVSDTPSKLGKVSQCKGVYYDISGIVTHIAYPASRRQTLSYAVFGIRAGPRGVEPPQVGPGIPCVVSL